MVTFALGPREVYVFGLLHGLAIGMAVAMLAVVGQARREREWRDGREVYSGCADGDVSGVQGGGCGDVSAVPGDGIYQA